MGFIAAGPERAQLEAAAAPMAIEFRTPEEAGLGARASAVLARPAQLEALAESLPRGTPLIALLGPEDEVEPALEAGASEVCPFPGSPALLRRRLEPYVNGKLGPGRLVLDPTRVTSLVHAVRNPLNVITLYAELLKMEPLGEDGIGSVNRLVRSAKRVDALVGELETLLYLQTDRAPVRAQPVDLGDLVDAALMEHRTDIQDKPVFLEFLRGETDTLASTDPDLTRRAVHAVLGRVIKLCLSKAQIRIRTFGPPPTLEIVAPISPVPPERAGVFDHPGTELDERESLGGVGVGLSFASEVCRAVGGRLEHDITTTGESVLRLVFASA